MIFMDWYAKMTGLPLVVINSHGHFDHIGEIANLTQSKAPG